MFVTKHTYENLQASESIKVVSREYLSIYYIQSASYFAKQSFNLEHSPLPTENQELQRICLLHKTYVISSILTSVCFLESTINELFKDCSERPNDPNVNIYKLDKNSKQEIADIYNETKLFNNRKFRFHSVLTKFNIFLSSNNKREFDENFVIYNNAMHLIYLRNTLVHYKPVWIDFTDPDNNIISDIRVDELITLLLDKRFNLNPLLPQNPVFTDRILSYGCADWSVKSCLNLADRFFKILDINIPYEHVRCNFFGVVA